MSFEYYRILGVPKDATDEDIQKAYKHLALFYNPKRISRRPKTPDDPLMSRSERTQKELAEESHRSNMYLTVGEAFDVLHNPERRAIYDNFGDKGLRSGVTTAEGPVDPWIYHGDPDQTFREFFGTDNPFGDLINAACGPSENEGGPSMTTMRANKEQVGSRKLPVSLEDAYNGAIRKVIIPKKQVCADGSSMETRDHVLTLTIPKGAVHGMEFTFVNEGDELPNAIPTDVTFKLDIQPHPVYQRDGNNLIMQRTITLFEAMCGVIIPINTLDGRCFRIMNVHMIVPGYEKVIKGEGMPILGEYGRKGDLIIRFKVKYPGQLSSSAKACLKSALGGAKYEQKYPLAQDECCVCPLQD